MPKPTARTVMPHTQVSLPSKVKHLWTIKEWDKRQRRFVPVWQRYNTQTTFGATAYASALGGSYLAPNWLVFNFSYASITALSGNQLTLSSVITVAGDNKLVLNPNPVSTPLNYEVVTFNLIGGSTYTLTALPTFAHTVGELVVRQVTPTDTLSSMLNEVQADVGSLPLQRIQSSGGYTPSAGNYIMQFAVTGNQALGQWGTIGLADSGYVGQGNLHNHTVSGYYHPSGTDVEVDINLVLTTV